MSGVLQRRDTFLNLTDLLPSDRELVQIEDLQRYGLKLKGDFRIVSQMLHRDAGHEMREYDEFLKKGKIGYKALDFSFANDGDPLGVGALGHTAVTFGQATTASGIHSFAIGNLTKATGENSIAKGLSTLSSGKNSQASGENSIASGENSIASGVNTLSSGKNSQAYGDGTIASGENSFANGNKSYLPGIVYTAETPLTDFCTGTRAVYTSDFGIRNGSNVVFFNFGTGILVRLDLDDPTTFQIVSPNGRFAPTIVEYPLPITISSTMSNWTYNSATASTKDGIGYLTVLDDNTKVYKFTLETLTWEYLGEVPGASFNNLGTNIGGILYYIKRNDLDNIRIVDLENLTEEIVPYPRGVSTYKNASIMSHNFEDKYVMYNSGAVGDNGVRILDPANGFATVGTVENIDPDGYTIVGDGFENRNNILYDGVSFIGKYSKWYSSGGYGVITGAYVRSDFSLGFLPDDWLGLIPQDHLDVEEPNSYESAWVQDGWLLDGDNLLLSIYGGWGGYTWEVEEGVEISTTASGKNSISIGSGVTASGENAVARGSRTKTLETISFLV